MFALFEYKDDAVNVVLFILTVIPLLFHPENCFATGILAKTVPSGLDTVVVPKYIWDTESFVFPQTTIYSFTWTLTKLLFNKRDVYTSLISFL